MKKSTPAKKPTKKQTTFSVSKNKDYSELAPQATVIMEAVKELGPIERKALIAKLTTRLKNYKQPAARLLSYYTASLQKGGFLAVKVDEIEAPAKSKPAKAKPAKPSAAPETPAAPAEVAPEVPAEAVAPSAVPVVPAS